MDIVVYTIMWWGGYDEPAVFMSADPQQIKKKYDEWNELMSDEDLVSIYLWSKNLPTSEYSPTQIDIEDLIDIE